MTIPNPDAFIITSTVNTSIGLIHPAQRFFQTVETVKSIRRQAPGAVITLVDNSSQCMDSQQQQILSNLVDEFIYIGQRRDVRWFNHHGIKGAGESYMLMVGLDGLRFRPRRVFKLSGRYQLGQKFDITAYRPHQGKYVFKTREINQQGRCFFHTRLWSLCGDLIDDAPLMISRSMETLFEQNITIEECIYKNIDLTKVQEFDIIHCHGYIAPWNQLIVD